MSVTLPRVVALWGAVNGVLAAILVGYHENPFAIALYASVVALLELVGLGAWLAQSRFADAAHRSPAALRSDAALVTAVGFGFVGAGFVWTWWMALPGLYSAFWLMTHGAQFLIERYAPLEPVPDEGAERDEPQANHGSAVAAIVGAASVATAAVAGHRWWHRRRSS